MINKLIVFALWILGTAGYGGLFLLSMLESAAIPIPSEVVLPFSGFLVSSGKFNLLLVVLIATAANLVGSLILYAIGRSGGRWLLERYGKYVLISAKEIDTGERWFKKYGTAAIFWGRMLPIVRTFISLPAGIAEMNVAKFSLFTVLGALPWNFALVYIGYKAGENWEFLHAYFQKADYIVGAAVIIGIIWYISRHFKKK